MPVQARNHRTIRKRSPINKKQIVQAIDKPVKNERNRYDFSDKTVIVIASGPSVTEEDIELAKQSGLPRIVTNLTFRFASDAEIFFAGDDKFLKRYIEEMKQHKAEIWTCAPYSSRMYKIRLLKLRGPFNSGLRAIQLAVHLGAKRILLLGFDCKIDRFPDGKRKSHFFGSHAKGMGDALSAPKWPGQFAHYARQIKGKVKVLNCSRTTALNCFPIADFEKCLANSLAENR